MIELTLAEIADITGGYLDSVADPQTLVTASVEFDSRKVEPGGLFIALPGEHVDGHNFAARAVEQGAAAVLAARPVGVPAVVVEPSGKLTGSGANADIYVHDSDGSAAAVVKALSALAREVTTRLRTKRGLKVVGVTGSAGKTSTKDLIATVLRAGGNTVAPPGSFNNEIGLPYTALRCNEHTRFLVAEMSARGIGHIAHLAQITTPDVGVVLNVGSAHLGEFGSRENIAVAKGELVEALPPAAQAGVAILNADDPAVRAMDTRTQANVVTYSAAQPPAPGASYFATDIELDDVARPTFKLHIKDPSTGAEETKTVKLQVFGIHQVSNALAAVAAARSVGVELEQIVQALQGHTVASAHRMDVTTRKDGVTIIDDTYNANPDSMRAAIAALGYTVSARPNARAVAVLGEMGELGPGSEQAHRAIAWDLAKYSVDHLVVVGDSQNCRALEVSAKQRGIHTTKVTDSSQAAEVAQALLTARCPGTQGAYDRGAPQGQGSAGDVARPANNVCLVKASNAQALWTVAQKLKTSGGW